MNISTDFFVKFQAKVRLLYRNLSTTGVNGCLKALSDSFPPLMGANLNAQGKMAKFYSLAPHSVFDSRAKVSSTSALGSNAS
jgi:hypothetical protein